MDLFSIVGKLWHHKLAAMPVILLTGLASFYVLAIKPPVYQSSAGLMLVNPPGPPSAAQLAQNPNINYNNTFTTYGDLDVIADAIVAKVTADSSILIKDGVNPEYSAVLSSDAGDPPIITITGTGSSPAEALNSANLVAQQAANDLKSMQTAQGINPKYLIKSIQLYAPQSPTESVSSKLRTFIAVIALGIILLFVAISMAESIERRNADRMDVSGYPKHDDPMPSVAHARLSDVLGKFGHQRTGADSDKNRSGVQGDQDEGINNADAMFAQVSEAAGDVSVDGRRQGD
jgi:capsular polysaccharide biosynthesis protein